MYDDILLPTDGSAGMDLVIDHAGHLAREHQATLHALYVVDTASLTDLPMESSWEGINNALQEEGQLALEAVSRSLGDLNVTETSIEGSPASEIVDFAVREGADLIVMGTHGRSGVDRLLLGSVAERVVRQSSVPVLSVNVREVVPSEGDGSAPDRTENDATSSARGSSTDPR